MALSAAEKTRFFADGYIVVRNLISQDELQTLRRDYEDLALGRVADFPPEHISVRALYWVARLAASGTPSSRNATTNFSRARWETTDSLATAIKR